MNNSIFNKIWENLKYIAIAIIVLSCVAGSITTGISCITFTESADTQDNQQADQSLPDSSETNGNTHPIGKCGDGICDKLERDRGVCPEDCTSINAERICDNEYYVTNPTSGSRLYVKVYQAINASGATPTVILIPGGIGNSNSYTDQIPGGSVVSQFTKAGINAVVFDPEGRGKSEGVEDFNGYTGQDGLYYITEFIDSLPEVGDIGYLTQSYGVALATGVLARYKNGPAIFLIDWEGPVNREDTTVGCKSGNNDMAKQNSPGDHSCSDDEYWEEREAATFALDMEVPYHRVQSLKDHVQPDISHAVDIIMNTTSQQYGGKGKSPRTKMNDFEPNTIFTEAIESELTENDKEKYDVMIDYARYLFDTYGGRATSHSSSEPGVVYFGFMAHLEGWDNEMDIKTKFDAHAEEARKLASIFEDYGAKVTFEANPEFVEGCQAWNENVLQELCDRGHGVGVHADKGYYPPGSNYTQSQFTSDIKQMKDDMEDLVDFEVQHVSGICSDLDWARAAIDAGYVFTTGGVGYCAMSMPVNLRPAEYRNCRNPSSCHGNMPLSIEDRIHPWRMNSAKGNWTVDNPDGELVYLSSDGGIKNLYEEILDSSQTHGDYEYSDEDIDIVIDKVEEAISLSDADKVNILYFSLSIGAADVDIDFYSKMFQTLQPFIDSGQLEYKTMNEMYEQYIAGL